MKSTAGKLIFVLLLIVAASGLSWAIYDRLQELGSAKQASADQRAAPVRVAPIERGSIALRRTFSGTLEAQAEFVVAPKVGGRVERIAVDVADTVERGQVVAELDNDEYQQAVAQAEADLAVAEANLAEARSALEITKRELERIQTLRERGVASESQLDVARADELAKGAQVTVAEAQVLRAKATLEQARIRLGYTRVTAGWTNRDQSRVVAERFVDEGQLVAANGPLLSIVSLHPINGIIYITERDYAQLEPGQTAMLTTDAFPGQQFEGRIARISPLFREASRQARVELAIDNADHQLKPGMFIRATVLLNTADDVTIVPEAALAERDDQPGVFVLNEDGRTVSWRPVTVGIREGDRVQISGEGLSGKVVTLGQQLIDDGSEVTIPEEEVGQTTGTTNREVSSR